VGAHPDQPATSSESEADALALAEVRQLILARWVDHTDRQTLLDGALRGMTGELDPFSDYISAAELAAFDERTTGRFGGLGIYVEVQDGLVVVVAPIEGTPAWQAGILPGDLIAEVDGVPCEFRTPSEAVEVLKGEPGTTVELTIIRPGAEQVEVIPVVRAVIHIQSVLGGRILEDGIGYVRITAFNSSTVDDCRAVAEELLESGLRGLIIDLRGNPGGYLRAAVELADLFLDPGQVIVETRGRTDRDNQSLRAESPTAIGVPLTVLLDGGSASASEILGGALRDHRRAALVGMRSFGKGSVQTLFQVQDGAAELKLTTAHYFTPNGRRIHRARLPDEDQTWGLIPDLAVELEPRARWELALRESDRVMAQLRARAQDGELPPADPDRPPPEVELHEEDPQVQAAFDHLRAVLAGETELIPPG
jgi:carboxyl-terminal processing protease